MLTGDEGALSELYRRRHAGIFRFALHMCGSPSIAEDVAQEVFIVLIRESHRFDGARGSVSAFLFGIARNQLLTRLRRERFYASIEDERSTGLIGTDTPGAVPQPIDALCRSELIASVQRAVLALPERYREVVVLCDLQELSYSETAAALGCAVGTVRSRLHRGRAMLIEKLRPEQPENSAASAAKSARCFA